MSLIASWAPRRANSVAIAWPMPEPAPVTTATFPWKASIAPESQAPGAEKADQCASGTMRDITVENSR
jgi:hypothetical protein